MDFGGCGHNKHLEVGRLEDNDVIIIFLALVMVIMVGQ